MVGVKKVYICNCNYKLLYAVVTSDYGRIMVVIMHQILVSNKFALFLYYDMQYATCLKHLWAYSCSKFSNDLADTPCLLAVIYADYNAYSVRPPYI